MNSAHAGASREAVTSSSQMEQALVLHRWISWQAGPNTESQLRLNGDLTPPQYKPGVHLAQKGLWSEYFLSSLFCPCSASHVLHPCSAPCSDVPARRENSSRTSVLTLPQKCSVLGHVRAFHGTWALAGESWMEKVSEAWWREHMKVKFASGQQEIKSGPQRLLPWHQGIFWAEEKNSSKLASVNKGIETRVEWWDCWWRKKMTGCRLKVWKKPHTFSGWMWDERRSSCYSIHKDWNNTCQRNDDVTTSILHVTEWRCPTVTSTGACAPRKQVRQGCVRAFHPSG